MEILNTLTGAAVDLPCEMLKTLRPSIAITLRAMPNRRLKVKNHGCSGIRNHFSQDLMILNVGGGS